MSITISFMRPNETVSFWGSTPETMENAKIAQTHLSTVWGDKLAEEHTDNQLNYVFNDATVEEVSNSLNQIPEIIQEIVAHCNQNGIAIISPVKLV